MSNELVKADSNIPGLEDAGPEDLVVPRIKMSCKAGVFENVLNKDIAREIECVLLTRQKGRQLWGSDDKIECRSRDRVSGSAYGNCEACGRGKWREEMREDDAERKKLCRATYEFLLLMKGQQVPFAMMVATPTSMGPAKKYISSFLVRREPLFAYTTMMTMVEKTGKSGKPYFVVNFERGTEVPAEDQKKYMDLMNRYRIHEVVDEAPATEEKAEDLEDANPDDIPF